MRQSTNKNYSRVYGLIATIPRGKIMTYGRIAKILHLKSARLVGRILHENADPEHIPCHRIVFSDGTLSKNYAFGGEQAQKEKLISENVLFKGIKVDVSKALYITP